MHSKSPTPQSPQRREVLRTAVGVSGLVAASIMPAHLYAATPKHVTAKTSAGTIGGVQYDGVNVFKGVPYGADTSKYRFRAPISSEPWKRVRDALEYGSTCPQPNVTERVGEDCLVLNLWTPGCAMGESGRSWSISTMSGQQITVQGPRAATLRAQACIEALNVPVERIDRVDTASLAQLVEASRAADPTLVGRSVYFGPVLDQASLHRHPFYPDAPPQSANIPMIIGNTRDETIAFLGNQPGIRELTWEQLPSRLLPELHVDIDPDHVIATYRRLYPNYSPTEAFFAATTAGRSWRGAIIEAELRAQQGSPVFAYQLNYRSPLENGRYGAQHAMDIPLVFDNVAQLRSLTGDTPEAQKTADQMSDAFIAFAKTGNPNHKGIPEWKPYELSNRATMVFDAQSQLVDDPRGEERKLFAAVPYIQRGTY